MKTTKNKIISLVTFLGMSDVKGILDENFSSLQTINNKDTGPLLRMLPPSQAFASEIKKILDVDSNIKRVIIIEENPKDTKIGKDKFDKCVKKLKLLYEKKALIDEIVTVPFEGSIVTYNDVYDIMDQAVKEAKKKSDIVLINSTSAPGHVKTVSLFLMNNDNNVFVAETQRNDIDGGTRATVYKESDIKFLKYKGVSQFFGSEMKIHSEGGFDLDDFADPKDHSFLASFSELAKIHLSKLYDMKSKRNNNFPVFEFPMLILGETGTGKQVLADRLRKQIEIETGLKIPFIQKNCAAIPDTLVESELFGSCEGAYTGSIDREGVIEKAEGGILFLDEIGEIPLVLQAKLLNVLQNGEFERVGDTEKERRKSSFILIAATNRDIKSDTKNFRPDLYARIAQLEVTLKPLRKRSVTKIRKYIKDELERLMDHVGRKIETDITDEHVHALIDTGLKYNFRDLQMILKKVVVNKMTTGDKKEPISISPQDFK
ncbi:MAG TPA: sigma-54 factor interaction domain-containing protein [bacterium]|nr:sigma-54 factor interaction domain-containing protein [bacterium]